MRKVCFVNYNIDLIGGVEAVTKSLAAALAPHYEVHILSMLKSDTAPCNIAPGVKVTYLNMGEKRFSDMQKELKRPIADYMNEHGIDIAFIQGTFPAYIAYPARFLCKTKFVFCDHGAIINQIKDVKTLLARFLGSVFCHKTVTLTKQNFEDYRKYFLTPKRKLECIYNWIDLDKSFSLSYDTGSKRVISAGRLGKEKGFELLVKAFAYVVERHPDWHLDIYGDGDHRAVVEAAIEEHSLRDNVHLMGMCYELDKKYKDYAMYALPSYREGMPLVLLEAKANRLPIVSFDIMTGPREIVRDGIDGILVRPYDTEEMGRSICKLIEDTDLRNEMSARSQENLNTFSKRTILNEWINLIESF